jgi:alpha-glutamyl/putrescinyl thymine pyrophosphorylase clade 1
VDYEPFFDFIKERHSIYLRRHVEKLPAPWTTDPILHKYRFTNVFRELDAVTLWYKKHIREPLHNSDDVMMATVLFRLFNRITTCEFVFCQTAVGGFTLFEELLDRGFTDESILDAEHRIRAAIGKHGPFCTGAYIVNSPNGMDKLTGVLTMTKWVFDRREEFLDEIKRVGTLQHAWKQFIQIDHIAGFTSYEFVSDLRHTALLENAPDILTWANPGPGALRGLNRIQGRLLEQKQRPEVLLEEMRELIAASRDPANWPAEWPALEMREIEHSLCEFDKYQRALRGQGRPRGVYPHA